MGSDSSKLKEDGSGVAAPRPDGVSASEASATAASAPAGKAPTSGKYKIALASSVLGGMPGMSAYHTSVVVDKTEYFFDGAGIMMSDSFLSHNDKKDFQMIEIGWSNRSGSEMRSKLARYFESGTYDLLRKNCNSFSDCALFYLCGVRLESKYCQMEKFGRSMSSMLSESGYEPNPKADGFDKEQVIEAIDPRAWTKKTTGFSLGGSNAETMADVRAKRLAALEARMGGATTSPSDPSASATTK